MNRTDEIGTLYNQYQTMLEENNHYIKSEYENKMILMDTQMKALESQINAHFLYNTLEAINSLAEIEGAEDISVMALALGDMFRYSIKTKGALVTLEKELAHVKNFVAIQQIRFDNGFRFEMDVPEELYSCRILKLILQPLVENALYHGLLHCNAGSSIYLSARKENKIIYFTVKDDGVGMASETLEQLQKLLEEKPKFGELSQHANESIGLKNINARIRLYYGEDYGLSVKSEQGCGTTVQIKIPEGTYGYRITQEVRSVLNVSESTLYPVLRRLQKDDCLSVYDREYGGRNRRYYKITEQGWAQLGMYREEWSRYSEKISGILLYGRTAGGMDSEDDGEK